MKESINIIKTNGKFYNVYEIDAYIFNYLFKYKVIDNNKVGFPDSVYNKIINVLESNHINYNVIYKGRENIYKNYGKINNYNKYKDIALNNMDTINKIKLVNDKINNCSKEQLDRLVNIIYEYFK